MNAQFLKERLAIFTWKYLIQQEGLTTGLLLFIWTKVKIFNPIVITMKLIAYAKNFLVHVICIFTQKSSLTPSSNSKE